MVIKLRTKHYVCSRQYNEISASCIIDDVRDCDNWETKYFCWIDSNYRCKHHHQLIHSSKCNGEVEGVLMT